MLNRLRALFGFERRSTHLAVIHDRRKPQVSSKHADAQLCQAIDRFSQTIVRKREEMHK